MPGSTYLGGTYLGGNGGITAVGIPPGNALVGAASATRSRGASVVASTTPIPGTLSPPSSLAAWQAMWDNVPLGTPSGWVGGDGCWSVTHPAGSAALFAFGDTPVLTGSGVVSPTGVTAVAQGAAVSNNYVVLTDPAAAPINIGDNVQVYLADGVTLRDPGVFTVASKGSFSGYTNLTFTFGLSSGSVAGDIVRVVTGGQTRSFPNSSAVLWTNAGLRLVSGPGNFVPNDGDGSWYWGGSMVVDTDGQLYVIGTKQGPGTPWTNLGVGMHRYSWTNPGAGPTWLSKVADIGPGIQWGAGIVVQGGWVYIFGAYRQSDSLSCRMYLARVASGSMNSNPTSWQFWTTASGGSWATGAGNLTSITNLQVVVPDSPGMENGCSAAYYSGQFRLASKAGGVYAGDVSIFESTSIIGPYVKRSVASAPYNSPTTRDQTYGALGHYDLPLLPNGKVLISVSRNQSDHTLDDYFSNTGWYRPKWFEASPLAGSGGLAVSAAATRTRGASATITGGVAVPPPTPGTIPIICELFVDGYWQNLVDASTYLRRVRLDQGITITRGQSGEGASQAVASTATVRLRDPDGFLSPRNPSGGWYGKIGRNTPIRFGVTSDVTWLDIPGPTVTGFNTGQCIATPDSTGLSITGDLDLRIDADLDSWSETTQLITKWAAGAFSYALVTSAGVPMLVTSSNGTSATVHACPYGLPASRGRMALGVTLSVNNGAGGRTITWSTAATLTGTYTALGPGVVYAGTTSIADTSAPVTIGANGGYGATPAGTVRARVYGAQIRQGIGGTLRGSPDFTAAATGAASVTDGQGNVWSTAGGAVLTGKDIRFIGEVGTWQLGWTPTTKGRDLAVDVEAAGLLRRLGQGNAAAKSALARKLSSPYGGWSGARIVAYWSCEDGDDSDGLASGLDGLPPMQPSGADTSYASYSGIPGSGPLPTLGLKATWQGSIPAYPATNEATLFWVMNLPTKSLAEQNIIALNMAGLGRVGVHTNPTGDLLVYVVTPANVQTAYGPYGFGIGGRKLRCELALTKSGANTGFILTVSDVDGSNGAYIADTHVGATFTAATGVVVSNAAGLADLSIGHVAVSSSRNAFYELGFPIGAANGYRGERAGRRIQRLCVEENVPFRLIGDLDETVECGVQQITEPVANMQAAADADGGVLSESRDDLSVMFVPRSSMQSQDPALSLPYARLSSLMPIEDDRWTRNDITVSRTNGSSRRRTMNSGRLSIKPPPLGAGRYDDEVELNVAYDRQLKFHAGWLLNLGTVDQARYPTIDLQLAHPVLTAAQEYAMRRLDIGQKLTVTSPPMWVQAEPITQLATGFSETIGANTYNITTSCVPSSPYEVAVYSEGTVSRYDSAASYLAVGDYGTTNTGLYVDTPSGPLWTTSGADLPFDLMISGERVTVTGIGAPSGTLQIFTVVRSVNGVVKPQANGTQIQLANPVFYSL